MDIRNLASSFSKGLKIMKTLNLYLLRSSVFQPKINGRFVNWQNSV